MDRNGNTMDTSLKSPPIPPPLPAQGELQETERKLKGYSFVFLIWAVGSQCRTVEALCGWGTGLEGAGWGERLLAASWPLGYGVAMVWSFRAALRQPVWAFGVPLALQSLITTLRIVDHGVLVLIGVVFLYFLFWRPFVAARKLETLRRTHENEPAGAVA